MPAYTKKCAPFVEYPPTHPATPRADDGSVTGKPDLHAVKDGTSGTPERRDSNDHHISLLVAKCSYPHRSSGGQGIITGYRTPAPILRSVHPGISVILFHLNDGYFLQPQATREALRETFTFDPSLNKGMYRDEGALFQAVRGHSGKATKGVRTPETKKTQGGAV